MSLLPPDGQTHSPLIWWGASGAAVVCLAALVLWVLADEAPLPKTAPAVEARALTAVVVPDAPERVEDGAPENPAPPSAAALPQVSVLEQRFRSAHSTEESLELAHQIAGWNDADAVHAIGRLFPLARHPGVKAALLSGLADIDSAAAPDARLAIFAAALGPEARDVRTAALSALAQFDDPRAVPLLRRAMSEDPDRAVRETASALHRARLAEDAR